MHPLYRDAGRSISWTPAPFFTRIPICVTSPRRSRNAVRAAGGWAVCLDQTAFYPEGGGQPWDLGSLADAQVLAGGGARWRHRTPLRPPLPVGQTVAGQIDWPRRFDLMQQHSGEHMLSGLIHSRYGFHNVGFHMGAGVTTIDFDGVIPQEDLPGLEAAVNEAIWRDLPVKTWFAQGRELEGLPYRSKRPLEGLVRLVEFPGLDLCACCGTHVVRTGEIGLLKLLSWSRFHQGVRMEMVCGRRALDYLSQVYAQNRMVGQTFSAKPLETGAAAQRAAEALEAAKAPGGWPGGPLLCRHGGFPGRGRGCDPL